MNIVSEIRELSEKQVSKQFWPAGERSPFSSIVSIQNGHIPHKNQLVFLSVGESDVSLLKHIHL